MRGVTTAPLFLRLGRRMRGPAGVPVGSLKRVLIDNITASGSSLLPSIIAGVADHPVQDIKVSNLYLEQLGGGDAASTQVQVPAREDAYPDPSMFGALPATGFFIRQARNIEMSHVEIAVRAADARPAFWLQDVDGFDGSFLKTPSGAPSFALDRVSRFRTFGSLDVPDKRFAATATTSF